MKRVKAAKKLSGEMDKFFQKNPQIIKALKVFDISYDQYEKALGGINFYTSTSTSSQGGYGQKAKHYK